MFLKNFLSKKCMITPFNIKIHPIKPYFWAIPQTDRG